VIPKDFAEEIKSNEAFVCSVGPGVTDTFTAVDYDSSSSKERIKKTSTKKILPYVQLQLCYPKAYETSTTQPRRL
jgi:hypothetical protein